MITDARISDAFINEDQINDLLAKHFEPTDDKINAILAKAAELKGLELEDIAVLLNIEKEEQLQRLYQTAYKIKDTIYGNRLVLFAPLYVSNYCSNNCLYCGFRAANTEMERKALNIDEIKEEVKIILSQGHKRILMLMGENHKNCDLDYFIETIEAAYSVMDDKGSSIRRINVEVAPLTNDEFKKLNSMKIKIGTYIVFQETYHRETYKVMHPTGTKSDYNWRVTTMDRALENGMNDVGIGVLLGLYDYKFEIMAMIQHAQHLDKTFGVGPHTISIPRIEPASGAPVATTIPHPVSDTDFKKLVAILRCSVPYTGMILSTRETAEMREFLFNLGISQISGGSRTNPGGYKQALSEADHTAQFTLNDARSTGEVITDVIEQGFIPSFCTACYRLGRVGQDFMDLAKPGLIKLHCHPNALTTLKEYLLDYADDYTKKKGEELIEKELLNIPNDKVREKTREYLKRMDNGERDLYF